jgi:hypothetical protein
LVSGTAANSFPSPPPRGTWMIPRPGVLPVALCGSPLSGTGRAARRGKGGVRLPCAGAADGGLDAGQRRTLSGIEDHDVPARHKRDHGVRVLAVERDHVRPHGIAAGGRPAEIGGTGAEIEPRDGLRPFGGLAHQIRPLVDQELPAEAWTGVRLVREPDLESATTAIVVARLRHMREQRDGADAQGCKQERNRPGAPNSECPVSLHMALTTNLAAARHPATIVLL